MKINHIGLNIQSEEEIIDFYKNILGFHFEYQFEISQKLAADIFGEKKQVKVFLYKRENILLELFINSLKSNNIFSHICLETKNREDIVIKCKKNGYKVIKIKRKDKADSLFIKDKSGNIFELKE